MSRLNYAISNIIYCYFGYTHAIFLWYEQFGYNTAIGIVTFSVFIVTRRGWKIMHCSHLIIDLFKLYLRSVDKNFCFSENKKYEKTSYINITVKFKQNQRSIAVPLKVLHQIKLFPPRKNTFDLIRFSLRGRVILNKKIRRSYTTVW